MQALPALLHNVLLQHVLRENGLLQVPTSIKQSCTLIFLR